MLLSLSIATKLSQNKANCSDRGWCSHRSCIPLSIDRGFVSSFSVRIDHQQAWILKLCPGLMYVFPLCLSGDRINRLLVSSRSELKRLRREKLTIEGMKAVKVYIPWSPMADVYSYGMTCYEILTGRTPFKGRNHKEEIDCVVKQGLRPDLRANLNPAIRDLIHSCWHQDPQQRPTFDAILLEFERILHELPRFMARMVDEVGNLPPTNLSSIEECIARLEQIEKELRAKYPKEFFVERDELDFVQLEMRWTRTMKKFVTRFGYKSYIDHPSLPWTLWFKRMKGLVKMQRLAMEVAHAFPFINMKKAICRWRLYITLAIFEGFEGDNSYPDEKGVIDEKEKLTLLQNWNKRVANLPPLVNQHHGCVQMNNHGHYEGNKEYPICDWCKEQEKWDVMMDVKFRLFDDKFPMTEVRCLA